jgi:3-deoxy-D-manno-octulosonic-acid transferase
VARPQWRTGVFERMGGAAAEPGAIWVHGASVGEVQAALPLIAELQSRGHDVAVSTSTLAGRALVRRRLPDVASHLAPIDHPFAVERAMKRVRPSMLALLEAELWPCRIATARRRGIPVALLSGRISDRSFERYQRLQPWVRRTLQRIDAIGARTETDAEKFRTLGARSAAIEVTGDLKFDAPACDVPAAPDLVASLGDGAVIVAGSTHPGEEESVLSALRGVETQGACAVLVIAPRDLGRVDDVERLAKAGGRSVFRRSKLPKRGLEPGNVLVLDSIGELRGLYAHANVAFVGGSLVPVGGHNLLEPVASGRPVLFGPHVGNAPHIARVLERNGSGRQVADASELGRAMFDLLRDPVAANRLGAAGREALQELRGSTRRSLELIEDLLANHVAEGCA